MKEKVKCPCLCRKVMGTEYYGIKCIPLYRLGTDSDFPVNRGETRGYFRVGWSKEQRENHYNQYCTGDFENCEYYHK